MEELTLKEQLEIACMPNKKLAMKLLLAYMQEHPLNKDFWRAMCLHEVASLPPSDIAELFGKCLDKYPYTIGSYEKSYVLDLPAECSYDLFCKILKQTNGNKYIWQYFEKFSTENKIELWSLFFTEEKKCDLSELTWEETQMVKREVGIDCLTLMLLEIDEKYFELHGTHSRMSWPLSKWVAASFPQEHISLLFSKMNIDVEEHCHATNRQLWYETPVDYTFKLWFSYFKQHDVSCVIHGWEVDTLLKMGVDEATQIILKLVEEIPHRGWGWAFNSKAVERIKTLPEKNSIQLLTAIPRVDDDN